MNPIYAVLAIPFIAILYYDIRYHRIPNKITYPTLPIIFLLHWNLGGDLIASGIGLAVGGAMALLFAYLTPKGFGMGDVKMCMLIGAFVGFPYVFWAIPLAILLALVAHLIAKFTVAVKKDSRYILPLAPFLVAGMLVALFLGDSITSIFGGR